MKKLIILSIFPLKVFSQTLYVAPEVDLKSLPSHLKNQLFAEQQMQSSSVKGVRDDLMLHSQMYLQNQVSVDEYEKRLWHWSQAGWSDEERWILIDTLKKSSQRLQNKILWFCRLQVSENCAFEDLNPLKLPATLQTYEGLILDGKPYPSITWGSLKISEAFYNWTFVSSRFPTFQFRGTWKELQQQQIPTKPLVRGTCEHPEFDIEIQNLSTQAYYNANCMKSTLPPIAAEKSFYQKNKKAIWWSVGLILGVGVVNTLNGKTLVIDKPGFM